MYITLKASSENKSKVIRTFASLKRFSDAVMEELPDVVEDTVANAIADVFQFEGPRDEWVDLAEYTQEERARLGYGRHRPILVREGVYRGAFINSSSPFYVSERESIGKGSFVQRIGTTHPLFPWHEEGTEFMPARPATPIGDPFVYEIIVDHLNNYLEVLLEDMLDA